METAHATTNLIVVNTEDMKPGDKTLYMDRPVTIVSEAQATTDIFERDMIRYEARSEDDRTGYIIFAPGIQWTVTREN